MLCVLTYSRVGTSVSDIVTSIIAEHGRTSPAVIGLTVCLREIGTSSYIARVEKTLHNRRPIVTDGSTATAISDIIIIIIGIYSIASTAVIGLTFCVGEVRT